MISLNINVAGGKKTSVKLDRFGRQLTPNLKRGINRATAILEAEIKRQLSMGGTVDRRKGAKRVRNPGVHLRVQDGTLRSSWTMKPAKSVSGGVEGHVSSPVVYSAIHEFGGRAGRGGSVTIPKRPYVKPAIEKKREPMVHAVTSAILKPLRTVA